MQVFHKHLVKNPISVLSTSCIKKAGCWCCLLYPPPPFYFQPQEEHALCTCAVMLPHPTLQIHVFRLEYLSSKKLFIYFARILIISHWNQQKMVLISHFSRIFIYPIYFYNTEKNYFFSLLNYFMTWEWACRLLAPSISSISRLLCCADVHSPVVEESILVQPSTGALDWYRPAQLCMSVSQYWSISGGAGYHWIIKHGHV